jgi:hypothetical protein
MVWLSTSYPMGVCAKQCTALSRSTYTDDMVAPTVIHVHVLAAAAAVGGGWTTTILDIDIDGAVVGMGSLDRAPSRLCPTVHSHG